MEFAPQGRRAGKDEDEDDLSDISNPAADDIQSRRWCRALTTAELFLLKASCIVGGGGFVFGYSIGVMSGALVQLEDRFALSDVESGLVMSALALGSVLGCVMGGPLCDTILGRWKTIQVQNIMFLAGSLLTAVAPSLSVVICGRFMVGIASSLSAIADIPYLTEIAPAHLRGRVSSSYEMLVVVGVMVSFVVDLVLNDLAPVSGWRVMFALPVPLILLQIIGMKFLPESPKFLLDNGHVTAAKRVLRMTLEDSTTSDGVADIDVMLDIMVEDIQRLDASSHCDTLALSGEVVSSSAEEERDSNKTKSVLARHVKRLSKKQRPSAYAQLTSAVVSEDDTDDDTPQQSEAHSAWSNWSIKNLNTFWEYKTPLIVILILMVFQQFTGGVVVRNYAPKIFSSAGFGYHQSLLFNLALGAMKVVSTAVAIYFVDTLGRKSLLLIGILMSSSGMLMLLLSFSTGLDMSIGVFLCAGLLVTAGYSLGFGPVCWVMQSECFPTSIRGRCMAISVFVSNLGQFAMTLAFPPLLGSSMHPGWIFFMFFVMSMLALLFVSFVIVETKGKQPKQILESWRL